MLNKSKILLGVMVLTVMFGAVAFFSSAKTASADCTITATLRVGSRGVEVQCLQTKVGATADGSFGPLTKAAVMAYQSNHGLSADGVVGPMSRAVLNAGGAVSGNFPAGCTSAAGFSSITGLACSSLVANTFAPSGCTNASGFSPVTGGACYAVSTNLPAGCSSGALFSSTTGLSCAGGSAGTGVLVGGAGDAIMTHYATSEKGTIKEGDSEVKVLGFRVEAQDSDIALQNVKVTIQNKDAHTGDALSSYRIDRYLDSVDIYQGSTKVGSADVADFTKDSGNIYSKSITLSNAVVRNGDKDPFYVVFNAISSMDTANDNAILRVNVDSYRFQDATGVIMTTDADSTVITNDVAIDTSDDALSLLSSSNNPDDSTVTVAESDTTVEVPALMFKLKAGSNSSDITLDTLPITVNIASAGASVTSSTDVIDSILVTIGSKEVTADEPTSTTISAGNGTNIYTADFSGEDVVIGAGETIEVKVYITFAEQGGTETSANYADGLTKVTASITGTAITAESVNDDTIHPTTGTQTGPVLTLSTSATVLSNISWTKSEGNGAASIDLLFTLEAGDNDIVGFAKSNVVETKTGISGAGVLTKISGTATETSTGVFTIGSGESANFRVRYTVTTSPGEVIVSTINGQTVPDSKRLSPTAYWQ